MPAAWRVHFQGGSVKRLFGEGGSKCTFAHTGRLVHRGFDFGKMVFDVTNKAQGAAGASAGPPLAIGMQGRHANVACAAQFDDALIARLGFGHGDGAVNCGRCA